MASNSNSQQQTDEGGVNAFEWLAGGLFFGGNNQNSQHKHKRELQTIESSKDVKQLWSGVAENWKSLLEPKDTEMTDANASSSQPAAAATTTTTSNDNSAQSTPEDSVTRDFLSARLLRLRFLLYEERKQTSSHYNPNSNKLFGGGNPKPTIALATVAYFVQQQQQSNSFLWLSFVQHMGKLPFESRKVVAHIFCYLSLCGLDGSDAAVFKDEAIMPSFLGHVVVPQFQPLMQSLVAGYTQTGGDIALHCGSMFRAMLRHAPLYRLTVGSTPAVQQFVLPFLETHVHSPNFDVASDAMECVRTLFVPVAPENADLAAEFMTRDYEAIWDELFVPKLLYNEQANNYMTKRMALQILSTVLLTRTNYNVMVRFVASARNCKVILLLLRNPSPHISLDAFHVFKVFVANPNKPEEVVKMLKDNKVKLAAYLQTLHAEKAQSDAQFRDERALIIATIEGL